MPHENNMTFGDMVRDGEALAHIRSYAQAIGVINTIVQPQAGLKTLLPVCFRILFTCIYIHKHAYVYKFVRI